MLPSTVPVRRRQRASALGAEVMGDAMSSRFTLYRLVEVRFDRRHASVTVAMPMHLFDEPPGFEPVCTCIVIRQRQRVAAVI